MSTNNIKFIDLPCVKSLTSLGKSSIYSISDFPRPIKIRGNDAHAQGGARWVESEVQSWMRSRIQMRDNLAAK
jgi:prophage regulatory protein